MALGGTYTTLDGREVDPEKQHDFMAGIDSDDSGPDSTSGTGMLRRRSSAARKANNVAFSYAVPRRRFTRYFTCTIALGLIMFMLLLTHASWRSRAKLVATMVNPVSKPPAWEEFPFLKRYHGGVRTLVSRRGNKPEYPDPDNNSVQPAVANDLEQQQRRPSDKGFQKREEQVGEESRAALHGVPSMEKFDAFLDASASNGLAQEHEHEPRVTCYLDKDERISLPQLRVFHGIPSGFPDPVMGSHSMFGLNEDVCFDRYGRLGPYGYGYSRKYGGSGAGMEGDQEGAAAVWEDRVEIDYRTIKWAEAQEICAEKNRLRYKARPKSRNHFFQNMAVGGPDDALPAFLSGKTSSLTDTTEQEDAKADVQSSTASSTGSGDTGDLSALEELNTLGSSKREAAGKSGKKLLPRTAILIRTWLGYEYDYEDLFYLRALVNELSLQSGGEYAVHFLIHVKDDNLQIWSDDDTYQRVVDDALPTEFRGMGTLWSERQMSLIYGGVDESNYRGLPVHGAYRSTYMPVQYFAHQHPEYDFFWHWEMDLRYTGHFYHLFDKVGKWARQQPRKGLWERNGRFYVPSEHGSWEDFKQMVRLQTEHSTAHESSTSDKMTTTGHEAPIWGPEPPTGPGNDVDLENDPVPPTTYEHDDYTWGVGEDADFITFNPLFDPHGTNWILAEDVTGYNTSGGFPPRRTAIITASRLSRRLLETMHRETALQRHTMFSEMWPGSCALHHGLKAVYAPHPVYIDRRWPTSYLAAIFNNGRDGASGGARTSVFSDERQHNFLGTTWYYHAGFPANLWKRWLGYKVDGDGGEEVEMAGEGRMCLPGMLLHPVKQVDMVYEHQVGE